MIPSYLFGLVHMMFNGHYKQRDNYLHPAWAWSSVNLLPRIPYSIIEAVVWSCVVYYTGFAPGAGKFFCFMFLLFDVHQMALGLFRTVASLARDMVIANTFRSAALLVIFLLGGFVIPKDSIKPWWQWAFWVSPLSYGQRALSVNEFTAVRWIKIAPLTNRTIGQNVFQGHNIPNGDYWYWIGVGGLLAYALLFNCTVTLALTYLNPLRKYQTVLPLDNTEGSPAADGGKNKTVSSPKLAGVNSPVKGMILPFQPLTINDFPQCYLLCSQAKGDEVTRYTRIEVATLIECERSILTR